MRRTRERGFSLPEVVVALGLLAAALISIAGLFVVGARQVVSGRNSSLALAAARTMLEETSRWSLRQSYRLFGFDGAATSYSVDTRTNGYAARWQPLLSPALAGGYATIEIQALGPGPAPPNLSAAGAIRLLVTVSWDEGPRHRSARLGTVRM
jgi:prepilin-type N-terminal cleavage/methylation domain-containing protein